LRRRRLDAAQSLFGQGADVFADLQDRRWWAIVQSNLAQALVESLKLAPAVQSLQAALATFTDLGDHSGEGNALFLLARAHRELGDLAHARLFIDRALRVADEELNQVWRAHWLVELGRIHLADGQAATALVSFQESASLQRQIGDRSREAFALEGAGTAYLELGRVAEAIQFLQTAADTHRALQDRWSAAIALIALATAVDHDGSAVVARSHREQALGFLAEFTDPRAQVLARGLSQALGAP
jgi:tetratricopeptide (TPR) repeat protein